MKEVIRKAWLRKDGSILIVITPRQAKELNISQGEYLKIIKNGN